MKNSLFRVLHSPIGANKITDSFDPASQELVADARCSFTLTLANKPNQALAGEKVGEVTATINEATKG